MIYKHVNFIPAEFTPKLLTALELIPLALAVGLGFYMGGSAFYLRHELTAKHAEMAALEATSRELQVKFPKNDVTQKNIESFNALQALLAKKNYWSEIFKELSLLTPENLWLTKFTNGKADQADANERLVIIGEAASQEVIAKFLSVLEASQRFSGARIKSSEKEENIVPARFKFEFSIPVKTSRGHSP